MTRELAEWDRAKITSERLAREAAAYEKAVAKFVKQTEGLSDMTRQLIFRGLPMAVDPVALPAFRDELRRLIETSHHLAGRKEKARAGAPQPSGARFVAALSAYNLLKSFGREPTLTKGGPFLTRASTIFEAATGEIGRDLTAYCKKVFDERAHLRRRKRNR